MDTRIKVLENESGIKKDALFYMANLYPEIGRLFSFYDSGKIEAANNAKNRALSIVDSILSFKEIIPAGREEWNVIKNFILGFDKLDSFERKILERYAEPFSYKFMKQYAAN